MQRYLIVKKNELRSYMYWLGLISKLQSVEKVNLRNRMYNIIFHLCGQKLTHDDIQYLVYM